jgi:hypothetical protein
MFLLFLKAPTFKEQRVGLFKNDLIYPFRRYSSEDGRSKFPSIVQALVMVTDGKFPRLHAIGKSFVGVSLDKDQEFRGPSCHFHESELTFKT